MHTGDQVETIPLFFYRQHQSQEKQEFSFMSILLKYAHFDPPVALSVGFGHVLH